MLGDEELESTSGQLRDYLQASKQQQKSLAEVLEEYGSLIRRIQAFEERL